jgi:hypothetical protein
MPKGRPVALIFISLGQCVQFVSWSCRPKTAQAPAMRSQIVLLRQGRVTQRLRNSWQYGYTPSASDVAVSLSSALMVCSMSRVPAPRAS